MSFSYQAQKLSQARHALMLPHIHGESRSIANAFSCISLAFNQMNEDKLDDSSRHWVNKIKLLMDATVFNDPFGKRQFKRIVKMTGKTQS
jgi:hypothetical protein